MRFRAKLVDIGCIQHFTRVVGTVAKLAKNCTLRLTTTKLYFILSEKVISGGIAIWCELAQGHFFNEYNMDGLSEESNEIYLDLAPDNLLRSLKSSQNAKSIKIKLTKKHTPCLTFEVELPSLSSNSRQVTHDVPVNVIPRRLWDDYSEPDMPDFDVSVYMPPLKLLRNVVDRMKNLSNFVLLSANQCGQMKIKVETDLVTVTTYFNDLDHPTWGKDGSQSQESRGSLQRNSAEFAEVHVDIRKLAQFLSSQQVNPLKVICSKSHH
ncbi:Checkpoint protein HUS1 [Lamellibrachia satsuma]|nr:Checkpoint protein HUS1 [Lamellibrachia satsuma]